MTAKNPAQTPARPRPRRRHPGRIALALTLALAATSAADAQSVPMLRNDYNLFALMPPAEAWLDSYLDCGSVRCDIAYRIDTRPVDRLVQVVWKDRAGATLVSGSNAYLSNFYNPIDFGGYVEALEWSRGVFGSAWTGAKPAKDIGTADFTGTSPGPDPCGTGYVCKDAEYYYWPRIFAPPAPAPQSVAAATEPLASISGTLSNVGFDDAMPEDIGDRRVAFVTFNSMVELDAGLYRYSYTVSNFTDLALPFSWSEAGLDGELDPFEVVQRSFTSTAAPTLRDSLTAWTLQTEGPYPLVAGFANQLDLLAPVPEPGAWMQLALGLALLGSASLVNRR